MRCRSDEELKASVSESVTGLGLWPVGLMQENISNIVQSTVEINACYFCHFISSLDAIDHIVSFRFLIPVVWS